MKTGKRYVPFEAGNRNRGTNDGNNSHEVQQWILYFSSKNRSRDEVAQTASEEGTSGNR